MNFATPIASIVSEVTSTSTGAPAIMTSFAVVIGGLAVLGLIWKVKGKVLPKF